MLDAQQEVMQKELEDKTTILEAKDLTNQYKEWQRQFEESQKSELSEYLVKDDYVSLDDRVAQLKEESLTIKESIKTISVQMAEQKELLERLITLVSK